MPKPAITKKSAEKKTPPKPVIVVTSRNAFGWLLSLFVVCGCMFVIGVLVGRGQAPVQFDTHEWEHDLNNLKISVLAKQEEIRGVIERIEIIDYLKEKGNSIQFYKQYIPPILSPKYGKTPPPKDTRPVAGEPPLPEVPSEHMVAMTDHQAPAPEKDIAVSAESAFAPDMAVIAGEGSPMDASELPETIDTEAIFETTAGQEFVASPTETFADQAPGPETIQEDLEKPAPATIGMIVTKTPATTKPSAAKTSPPPPTLSFPAGAEADMTTQASTSPSEKTDTDMPSAEAEALPERRDPEASSPLQYAIQVTSLKELDKANAVRDKFRSRGYPAYCQSSEVRGGIWHRVRIGPYPDRHTADQDYLRLKEVGVDALVFVLER